MAKWDGLLVKWAKKVREAGCCAICGQKGNLHAHHILPKQILAYKYDYNNGIALCFAHHIMTKVSVHQNALYFTNWLKTHRKWQYDIAMERLNETG